MDNSNYTWYVWLTDYRDGLSAEFTDAVNGLIYYFEAMAIDSAGNHEVSNYVPECSTFIDMHYSGFPYVPGDLNMSFNIWPPTVTGSDVVYFVNQYRGIPLNQPCLFDNFWCPADIDGNCIITGEDITALVGYFKGLNTIEYCPDYEPIWPPIPDEAPPGWPGCDVLITNEAAPINDIE